MGPTANPIGPDAPNTAIVVPSRCVGVTSRMPASITPVLPSWNPMSSIERASCQGSCESATPANTTASTRALRTMTALRLYLSAQTPHSGTSGIPTTKTSALKSPMNASRSASATPIWRRYAGRSAKTWLTPRPSTIEVTQKTATRTRQSWAGREGGTEGAVRAPGSGIGGSLADARDRLAGRTKAPEGTGGTPSVQRVLGLQQAAVPGRRRVPRSLALRLSSPVPGAAAWIAPRCGLAVHSCPFGRDQCTVRGPRTTTGLSTNLQAEPSTLSPKLWTLWTGCGYSSGRCPIHGPSARAARGDQRPVGAPLR